MEVEVVILKELPKKQLQQFQDRVVYYTAVGTREYVKSKRGYPYLSGTLEREEVSAPVLGSNKEYSLLAGTDYAHYVWDMSNVHWTNKSTIPQWYYTAFNTRGKTITLEAVSKALKELKK